MEVKTSIIIPVYNVEDYLEECLYSAVNQSLREIEIIAVNDGSTDRSLEILKKYEKKYENFIIIDQENKGLSGARNSGLKVAKGKYIYFLDSDDYIELDLVEKCYNYSEDNNLDIVAFDAKVFYTDFNENDIINKFNYDRNNIIKSETLKGKTFLKNIISSNQYRSSVCLHFYNRSFLIDNKINFYEGILHEDELFTFKCLLKCNNVRYYPNKFFNRRVRPNSIMSSSKSIKNSIGYYIVAEEIYSLIKEDKELIKDKYIIKHLSNIYYLAVNLLINRDNDSEKSFKKKLIKSILSKPLGIKFTVLVKISKNYLMKAIRAFRS